MKILELRFKNLNSLYGEWVIDFSSSEYIFNSIFAITGPTGAGKSTILDAICLALYGSTPRLGKITKSSNEIMSRQTGECYAEVTFESQAGKFRCHWSQHRARKMANRELVDSKHEIADAVSGQILESKKRDVANVIEKKTGMDFERFTRSILLAQGDFAGFLQAAPDERAPILEQITGTEIYSEISKRVHERQRDEHDKLDKLLAVKSGIIFFSEEEEAEIIQELAKKQKSEAEIAIKHQEIEKSIQWLTRIDELRCEITNLSKEAEEHSTSIEVFKPEREKLICAQKAAEFEGAFATLTSIRKQQDLDQTALKTNEEQLPKTEVSVSKTEDVLKSAQKATAQAKKEQKSQAPLLQKVRLLDVQLADKKTAIDTGESDCKKANKQIAEHKIKLSQTKAKLETARKDIALTLDYLSVNARDESLVTRFAGIEEQINNLQSVLQDISDKKDSFAEAEKHLKSVIKVFVSCSKGLASRKQEYKFIQKKVVQKKAELSALLGDHLLREYCSEKESLLREIAFLRKIADLESERSKLEDGKPCPLCGSEKHPFAEGNVPEIDETEKRIDTLTELIQKAEQIESSIKELETYEKEASVKVNAAENQVTGTTNERGIAEKSLKDITDELTKINDRFAQLKALALINLQPLGIQEIPDGELTPVLSSLNDRLKNWQVQHRKKEEIEKQSADFNSEIKRLDAIIETHNQSLSDKQNALDTFKKEFEDQSVERSELFGLKEPDEEENRLEKLVSIAEQVEKNARIEHDEGKQLLNSIKVRITSLQECISIRIPELQSLETDFIDGLNKAGFTDEQSFMTNRLSVDERNRLSAWAKELDDKQTDIQARKKDRESRLTKETLKKITESSIEDLGPVEKEIEETLKKERDEIGGLKQRLTDNNAAKERIQEKQALIDAQKNEVRRWQKLHSLIGSSDGKKYRNFAQGLTFEIMVSHANRQLEKMTDRYLLIRDDEQPLDLNVVDNYQAGEIRSTKNLSGGESFIVSLSLALGLSKMASRKVRVDSLFLDEGFGTLDEEALEIALETLAGLQQDGKLIGIISHVSAVKERIPTQIIVQSVSAGKSTITGPGCRKAL